MFDEITLHGGGRANAWASVYVDVDTPTTDMEQVLAKLGERQAVSPMPQLSRDAKREGLSLAARRVTKAYTISERVFLQSTRLQGGYSQDLLELRFVGNVVPLMRFDSAYGPGNSVSARVKASSQRATIAGAYRMVGRNNNVFPAMDVAGQTTKSGKRKVKSLYGPSTTSMIGNDDDGVIDGIQEDLERLAMDDWQRTLDRLLGR